MGIQLKNNAVGYLATAITASDTGIVLQTGNGAGFPTLGANDYFYATLESSGGTLEVIKVTARSGDSLTVQRAQDGTSANSFAAGARFEMRVNAKAVIDTIYSLTNYQGGSATNPTVRLDGTPLQAGDFYFNTSSDSVRFYNGASWQSLTTGSITVQNFTGNGSTTIFTLATAPTGEDNTQVYLNGVYQQKNTYSISGTSLTFSVAPPLGATIEVVIIEAIAIGSTTAGLVSYTPPFTGSVATNVGDTLAQTVSVKDFGAVGDGVTDDTAAIQAAATYISSVGGDFIFPEGDYVVTTRIDFTGNGVNCVLDHNAGILYNTPDYVCFKFTGSNCSVVGGLGRGFIGPAAWDGANVPPTYGVIWFGGNGCIAKTRLFNIRKMGIWFKDVVDGTAESCIIEGNYPSGSWTGTQVGHVGIGFDPSTSDAGNFKLLNNTIKSCVQGCLPANYGTGGVIQGFVATGNLFDGCWNHGIYTINTNGGVITGNNFNRCQIPIVVTGDGNTISGNTMYTSVNTSGDARDSVGISVRDGSRNIIVGNTIKGTLDPGNNGAIVIQDVNLAAPLNDNVVANNTINITAGSGSAIRIGGTSNAVNRNIIEGNNITCPGFGIARGAIEILSPSGTVNAGNKVVNNTITLTAQGEPVFASNLTGSEVRGNTFEVAWNSGTATNVYGVWWSACTLCSTQDNILYCRPGNGSNITFYLYRESGSTSNNFLSDNINAVGGAATYAFGVLVANSGLTVNQLGTGVPNFDAKIGSMWRRSDGGVGSTLYIKESGTDASGWVAK